MAVEHDIVSTAVSNAVQPSSLGHPEEHALLGPLDTLALVVFTLDRHLGVGHSVARIPARLASDLATIHIVVLLSGSSHNHSQTLCQWYGSSSTYTDTRSQDKEGGLWEWCSRSDETMVMCG